MTVLSLSLGDPSNAASATGDPYKTLFVARIVSKTHFLYLLFLLGTCALSIHTSARTGVV